MMVAAESARRITATPIPKLDESEASIRGPYHAPLERVPRVDEYHCVGCNLCSLVCPVPECITMERVSNGLPAQSWEERVTAGYSPEGVTAPTDFKPSTP